MHKQAKKKTKKQD